MVIRVTVKAQDIRVKGVKNIAEMIVVLEFLPRLQRRRQPHCRLPQRRLQQSLLLVQLSGLFQLNRTQRFRQTSLHRSPQR